MSFANVRLRDDIERGVTGGPEFNTNVASLSSGFEQRNQSWAQDRRRFDVGYGVNTEDQFGEILNFFKARRGRLFGFRFKDWSDYNIESFDGTPQTIGTGDGVVTQFQIIKTYTDAGGTYTQNILKPVDGTVEIFIDGVLQTSGVLVNFDDGVVTFSTAPALNAIITCTGEYDIPVRFDTDRFDITLALFNAGSIPNLPIVEDRIQPTTI